MFTEEERVQVKHIRDSLETRPDWVLGQYGDFYDKDVKFLLLLADKLEAKEPKELVREVMKIGPAEMPNLTPEQRVCVGCQECCKYLTFIVGEGVIKAYREVYEARGCVIRTIEGSTPSSIRVPSVKESTSFSFALRVPSVCPHLTEHGCDIYEGRPKHCREYDGRFDPYMQDLCKLINFRRG